MVWVRLSKGLHIVPFWVLQWITAIFRFSLRSDYGFAIIFTFIRNFIFADIWRDRLGSYKEPRSRNEEQLPGSFTSTEEHLHQSEHRSQWYRFRLLLEEIHHSRRWWRRTSHQWYTERGWSWMGLVSKYLANIEVINKEVLDICKRPMWKKLCGCQKIGIISEFANLHALVPCTYPTQMQ